MDLSYLIPRLLLPLVLFLILGYNIAVLGQNATRYLVALNNLPMLFSNDKLPIEVEEADTCFKLIGCIKKLPNNVDPQNPIKMKTVFKVSRAEKTTMIPFEYTINCLLDSSQCETYPYNLELLLNSSFDRKLRTVFVIGGYMSDDNDQNQSDIMNLWNSLEDLNMIFVSWAGGNRGLYQYPVANTKVVSRQITVFLYYLGQLKGFDITDEEFLSQIIIVGHSLGAHIAGFVGQDLAGLIGRVTGLDPAGPLFIDKDISFKLDKSDAVIVDAIHTNGGDFSITRPDVFGHGEPVGHIDYYANDGRYQPGCLTELTGCSHRLATLLYKSFLEHELYMRKHLSLLKKEFHELYRIFAYRSATYEEFKNGSSLVRNCPQTVMSYDNLLFKDINSCLIPVDFVSHPYEFKKELISKYQMNFYSNSKMDSKFFFYTQKSSPYLNDHQLLELKISKQTSDVDKSCNINLNFRMAGGRKAEYQIKNYELVEEDNYYRVIVPFLALNLDGKYQLATLDAHDFFLGKFEKLKQAATIVFPVSVRIDGFKTARESRSNSGLLGMVKNFFGLAEDGNDDDKLYKGCEFEVEAVTIQPLKRIHRLFKATYSLKAQDKTSPDIVVLMSDNSTLPKIQVSSTLNSRPTPSASDNTNLEVYLDTIIVGPYNEALDKIQTLDEENIVTSKEVTETSSIRPIVWIILTTGLILSVILLLTLLSNKILRHNKNEKHHDERRLISTLT